VTVQLNFESKVATLVTAVAQPEGLTAASQGNAPALCPHASAQIAS
jgi:hypothetical protein